MVRRINVIIDRMESANCDRPNDYNRSGKQNNDDGLLKPGPARLLAKLISLRQFQLLAEVEALETETVTSLDWHDMPGVAREYQSAVAGESVKVDDVEGFEVKAQERGDDPVISFEEKPSPPAMYEPDDFDNLPLF